MHDHSAHAHPEPAKSEIAKWKAVVAKFEKPCTKRALWQLFSTLGLYLGTWTAMYFLLPISKVALIPLVILNAGFTVRLFIIFHDCCHNSFLKNPKWNRFIGFFTGMLTFTSFKHWRWEHSVHHATAGDLDRRGVGDIWTLTVEEYLELPKWKRLAYRAVRNPFLLFVVGPFIMFVIRERFPVKRASAAAKKSVWATNFALACWFVIGGLIFGWLPFVILQLGIMAVAASAGVWLFYVQHQFEGVYWERHEHWEYTAAALEGSSFYKLPRLFQWFSGNIGFHHVHHLSSKIPNYYLEECHYSHPSFQEVKPLTVVSSMKSFTFRLWDEKEKALIGWRRMREIRPAREAAMA